MALPVRALERVTLRNGLTMDCARHENLGDQVRLYSGRGKEYQDVSFLQIVSIDYVPDALAKTAPKPLVLPQPIVLAKVKAAPALPASKPQPSSVAALPPPVAVKPLPLYVAPKPVAAPALAAAVTALQPGFPEMEVHDLLQRAGTTYNIDAELLASIIHAESGGNARATSRYGARGLMQLMPTVGRTYGASDLYQPGQNVSAGTAFLDALLRKYNDNLPMALAAYNAGPGAVARYHGVPPSARGYVGRVMNEFYRRKLALGAKPTVAGPVKVAAVKPLEVAALQTPKVVAMQAPKAAAVHSSRRGRSAGSIHREWSGQRAFATGY